MAASWTLNANGPRGGSGGVGRRDLGPGTLALDGPLRDIRGV